MQAFAKSIDAVLINVTASVLFSKWVGESNKLTSAIFDLARIIGDHGRPTIIFLDEVDAILGDGFHETEHIIQARCPHLSCTRHLFVSGHAFSRWLCPLR